MSAALTDVRPGYANISKKHCYVVEWHETDVAVAGVDVCFLG
jgi:hypothetical protein